MDDKSLWGDLAACRGAHPELFFPLTESGPGPRAQSWTGRERP